MRLLSPLFLCLVLLFGLVACGETGSQSSSSAASTDVPASEEAETTESVPAADEEAQQKARRFRILDQEKKPRWTFRLQAERVSIDLFQGDEMTVMRGFGPLKGKRRYRDVAGRDLYAVLANRRGFELSTPSGERLWRVRLDETEIFLHSPEGESLRLNETAKQGVLRRGDEVLGRSRRHGERPVVMIRDGAGDLRYRMFAADEEPLAAALLLAAIPDEELAVLAVEILLR